MEMLDMNRVQKDIELGSLIDERIMEVAEISMDFDR